LFARAAVNAMRSGSDPARRSITALSPDPAIGKFQTDLVPQVNVLHWGFSLQYNTYYLTSRFTGGPPKTEPLMSCARTPGPLPPSWLSGTITSAAICQVTVERSHRAGDARAYV
jgi:hypothetical protein